MLSPHPEAGALPFSRSLRRAGLLSWAEETLPAKLFFRGLSSAACFIVDRTIQLR